MIRIIILAVILWLLLFGWRIFQIGGIDPTYRDEGNQLLLPTRDILAAKIDQILPYPQSGLLSGIILGSTKNLPYFLKTQLQATSTIHIVVVSGQNLTIMAGFIMSLTAFLGRRKTIFLTLISIVFYSLLTGLGVPVIRAALMVSLSFVAQILGKEKTGWWVLLLTAAGMLLFNPNWLLSISFQLSFLATLGVVVVSPILSQYLKLVPRVLREDLAVTIAAQLLTLPVIAYNFYQVSLVGILVNSLILWSIPIVMIVGFFSLVLGFANILLGQLLGLIPGVLLTYFIYLVQIFAKLPFSAIRINETGMILWVGYYLLVGVAIWMLQIKKVVVRKIEDRG